MTTHWLIQKYTNKVLEERFNEYIPVENIPFGPTQLEQVWKFCICNNYDVKNITGIETSTKYIHENIVTLMLRGLSK